MSQRRANKAPQNGGPDEEAAPFVAVTAASLELDEPVDDQLENEKIRYWKESPFAVGLTEPSWKHEIARSWTDDNDADPTGCLCCSAGVCSVLGAGRVGNMAVLHSSTELVEEVEDDDENGQQTVNRYKRPKLNIVVGPYWPILIFVTYPIIFSVSAWAFVSQILPGNKPLPLVFVWTVMTTALIVTLACTGCRDPGILYRVSNPPPQTENSWRWSDQALTYRPRGSFYDIDTAVVVRGFDHT